MSFQFDTTNQTYRALLFVNGWQYGKVGLLVWNPGVLQLTEGANSALPTSGHRRSSQFLKASWTTRAPSEYTQFAAQAQRLKAFV